MFQARKVTQQEATRQLEIDIQCLKDYEMACKSGNVTADTFTYTMGKASKQAQDYATNIREGAGSSQVYAESQRKVQSSLKATSTASQVASIGVKALSAALNMFAGMAIAWGISKVIEGIEYLATASERAIEKTKELQEEISQISSDYQSERQTLEGLREEYDSLTAKIGENGAEASLSADEYERYRDITSEILGITPKLITGWDDEGRAISNKNGLLQQSIDLLDEEYQKSLRNNTTKSKNEEIAAGIIESKNNFDNSVDTKTKSGIMADMRESFLNELEKLETQLGMTEHDIVEKMWVYFDPNANPNNFWSNHVDTYEELRNLISSDYDKLGNSFIDENNPIYELFSDEVIDEMIQKADEYFQELARIESEEQQYYQQYKDQLNLNAQAVGDAYNSLSDETKAGITQMIDSFDYSNMTKDKFSDMAIDLKDFVGKLSTDGTLLSYFDNLFKPMGENESIEDYEKRVKTGIDNITSYCETNYPAIKLSFGDVESDVEDLKAKYNAAIARFTGESNDADLEKFFEDNSINDESEIDYFNKVTEGAKTASEAIEMYNKAKSDTFNDEPPLSFSETLAELDKMKDKFDTLDKTYSKLFDSDKQIGIEDYSSINEAFKDVADIESYIQRLQEAGQNQEEVTAVMEDLISAYLDYTGLLDNVTEENASLIEQTLTELGVLNSKELVLARLSGELINMSNAEEIATAHGLTLTDVTWEEINALVAEGSISEQVAQQLAYFAIQKQITNDTVISTDGDCQNLINLAKTAGYSESVLTRLEALKNRLSSNAIMADSMRTNISNAIKNVFAEAEMDAESINFKLPEVKYNGGSSTKSAMNSAAKSAKEEFEELFDFFEQRVKVLNNAISLLETNLENVSGSFAKNTLLNQGISLNAEKINNYTDALAMYTQKANEALSKLPSDIAQKIQNGAVDLTNFVGDGNKDVVEAIKDYQSWADKISDCKQQLAELKETIRQLELDKFNNIVEDFSNIFDIRDDSKSLIEKQIGLLEEAGQLIGDSFYTTQIEQSQKQLALLEQEKANLTQQLTSALSSGNIQQGTDEWLEMVNALTEVESSILDVKTEIEELDNALLNLHTEVFERIQEQFSNLSSELENLDGLFDDFDVADEKGNWSNEGLAQLGLLAQQYELAQYQVQQYNEEIAELNKQYLAGRYSATEYADRLAELSESQWEAVNSSEAILDSIISLNEARVDIEIEGINKEIEAYKELIDAQIEALEASKNLHDYEESIAEKTKSKTKLEEQIAAMLHDNTASTIAKRKKLEEQLADATKDLEEAQYDHSIETQKDALNKQYEDFEEEKNAEIEALEESLENREELIANSFENVKANTDLVGQQIAVIAQQHGVTVSDAIINSWKSGENAIASYGNVLSAQTSSFIGQLIGVENEVYALQNQANVTAVSLATVFSTRADTLVNELTNSWYGAYNLNQMTNALQSSLSNALERGYNVSGITSALNSVTSAANSAKSALDALNNTPTTVTTTSKPQNEYYYVDRNGNRSDIYKGNPSSGSKGSIVISKYASGTRSAKGGLSITDEEGYELKLPKLSNGNYTITGEGDQVLTKVQTDNIFEWSKFNPDMFVPQVSIPTIDIPNITPKNIGGASLNIGKLVEVNGNIDNTNIARMENVAKKAVNDAFNQLNKQITYGGN